MSIQDETSAPVDSFDDELQDRLNAALGESDPGEVAVEQLHEIAQGADDGEHAAPSEAPAPDAGGEVGAGSADGAGSGPKSSTADHSDATSDPLPAGVTFTEIQLDLLVPAEDNPRRDVGDIDELAITIGAHGIVEPLVVMPRGLGADYLVVCGHRRLAAARKAGLTTAPCLVRTHLDDSARIELMLIENLQRDELAPLEEAAAFKRLVELGHKQRRLAKVVGRSQGHISKRIALLSLPANIQKAIDSGGITVGDAVELTKLPDAETVARAWKARDSYGGIARFVESELQRRENERAVAKARKELEAAGVKVLENRWASGDEPERGQLGNASWELNLSPEDHAAFDCHAAWISPGGRVEFICLDISKHPDLVQDDGDDDDIGPAPEGTTPEQKAEWEAERAAAAEKRRRTDEALAARRTACKAVLEQVAGSAAAGRLIARQLVSIHTDEDAWGDLRLICELLGVEPGDPPRGSYRTGEAIALLQVDLDRGALAAALAIGEAATQFMYGTPNLDIVEPHFAFLEEHGYELSEIDEEILTKAAEARAEEEADVEEPAEA